MEEIKLKPIKYFYCVVDPNGFVQVWHSAYYRGQAIDLFIRNRKGYINDWNEAKKLGYTCQKLKLELWKR